jgi:uncharacterized membrane protein YgcG
MLSAAVTVLALGGGCRPADGPPAEEASTGSDTTATTGPMATTFAAPDACQSSEDCSSEELFCVAPYDPGLDPPIGPGVCIDVCIEADDLSRWCFDDAACCGQLRCNEVDGFCESLTTATGDSSGTDTGTSSGTDTGGTESTGSSSGSGSSGSGSGSSGSGSGSTTGGT